MNKGEKSVKVFKAVVVIAAVVFAAVLMFSGSVTASVSDNALVVDAPFNKISIPLSDISHAEMTQVKDYGRKVLGLNGLLVYSGKFKSTEYGEYLLSVYTKNKACIYIKYNDKILLLNQKSVEDTQKLFDALNKK